MITNDNKKLQKNALCKMYLKNNYILENIKLWSKNNFSKYVKNMILDHKGLNSIFYFLKYFLW